MESGMLYTPAYLTRIKVLFFTGGLDTCQCTVAWPEISTHIYTV